MSLLQPNDQSGYQAAAYFDANRGTDGSYVIANKGTATGADWKNDLAQSIGLHAQQYEDARIIAQAVNLSDVSGQIEYTGHSLAGGLASL